MVYISSGAGGSSSSGSSSSTSSSGGGGGGMMLYMSPEDFSVAYTSAETITLTGLSFTPSTEQFVSVLVFPSSGSATLYTPSGNAFSYNSSTGVLTVTSATFASGDSYQVLIYGPDKAYSKTLDATQVVELSPVSGHYNYSTLADETDHADTAGTYYYFDMDGYRYFGLQFGIDGGSGTVSGTVEVSLQNDGTAADACTYIDATNDLFGVVATTGDTVWLTDKPISAKYGRVKVESYTGGADDADWTIYLKKIY